MNLASTLVRLDAMADTVRSTIAFVDAHDEHGIRWELADLALMIRWLVEDLEKEAEASAE